MSDPAGDPAPTAGSPAPGAEEYRGYFIVPIQHAPPGHFIQGRFVRDGFVVSDRAEGVGINVMPGATWFETVEGAREGIACLLLAGDGPGLNGEEKVEVARRFWILLRALQAKRQLAERIGWSVTVGLSVGADGRIGAEFGGAAGASTRTDFDPDDTIAHLMVCLLEASGHSSRGPGQVHIHTPRGRGRSN